MASRQYAPPTSLDSMTAHFARGSVGESETPVCLSSRLRASWSACVAMSGSSSHVATTAGALSLRLARRVSPLRASASLRPPGRGLAAVFAAGAVGAGSVAGDGCASMWWMMVLWGAIRPVGLTRRAGLLLSELSLLSELVSIFRRRLPVVRPYPPFKGGDIWTTRMTGTADYCPKWIGESDNWIFGQ